MYLKFSSDVQSVLRALVQYGLESPDPRVVHETLVSMPMIFPPDFDTRFVGRWEKKKNIDTRIVGWEKKKK